MEAVATLIDNLFTASGSLAWATWSPTASTPASTMTLGSASYGHARYTTIGKMGIYTLSYSVTLGGSAEASVRFTLPWTFVNQNLAAMVSLNNSGTKAGVANISSTTQIAVSKYDGSNFALAASGIVVSGFVELP